MKAIVTKYHGPTQYRSAYYCASDGDGNRATVRASDWDGGQGPREAVKALCAKMGWSGSLVEGGLMQGGHSAGEVFVWRQEGLAVADELVIPDRRAEQCA